MAIIGNSALTLADWASRVGDDGKIAQIVNILSQTNEILDDMLWVEGNLPTGHKTTIRTGLPVAYWRMLNQGVPKGKSTTAAIIDTCGMLETYSEVDEDLVALSDDAQSFRVSEDMAFLEGMNQQMVQVMMYGNPTTLPAAFMGFAPRYPSVSSATAQTAANVIDAGGTGSTNTSIWLVMWGPQSVCGIFPKGGKAGLIHEDMGRVPLYDPNNNVYYGYRTHYKWNAGLCVRDWRYIVRIANIDATALSGGSAPDLIKLMIRAINRLPIQPAAAGPVSKADVPLSMGRAAFYCNRAIRTWLDIQSLYRTNAHISLAEIDGRPATTFRGIPIRTVDQILNTEARLV